MDIVDLRRVRPPDEYPVVTRRLLLPLLVPLSALYGFGASLWRGLPFEAFDIGIPVVSVGSLAVGGSGKTPVCMRVAERFRDLGRRVCVLSRGYRRRSGGSPLVVSDGRRLRTGVEAAGDEPYMMAKRLDGVGVVVGRDRAASAIEARDRLGADMLVLDDGFQARNLTPRVDVLCFDLESLEHGGRLLPWGSFREGWSAVRPEHLVVVVLRGRESRPSAGGLSRAGKAKVFYAGRSTPVVVNADCEKTEPGVLSGARFGLVSGIARPTAFERTCMDLGATIPVSVRFRDHHWYTDGDARFIAEVLQRYDCKGVLTTEKDIWKLPGVLREISLVLRTRLDFLEPDGFWKNLDERLG